MSNLDKVFGEGLSTQLTFLCSKVQDTQKQGKNRGRTVTVRTTCYMLTLRCLVLHAPRSLVALPIIGPNS